MFTCEDSALASSSEVTWAGKVAEKGGLLVEFSEGGDGGKVSILSLGCRFRKLGGVNLHSLGNWFARGGGGGDALGIRPFQYPQSHRKLRLHEAPVYAPF